MTGTRLVIRALGGAVFALCLYGSPAFAQKHMQEAIDQLEQAKHALRAARWSSSSRKTKALDAIDKAIEQAHKGIREGRRDDD